MVRLALYLFLFFFSVLAISKSMFIQGKIKGPIAERLTEGERLEHKMKRLYRLSANFTYSSELVLTTQ